MAERLRAAIEGLRQLRSTRAVGAGEGTLDLLREIGYIGDDE